MNDQPLPSNSGGAGEVPATVRPEDLQAVPAAGGEVARGPEVAPAVGASPAPAPVAQAAQTPPPKLTPAEVTAAIAAMPGGGTAPGTAGSVPTPVTADDVEVIEPEWVDKAEEQVRQHAGDPHGEEEAIEELQEDYLQKRYGMTVADPNKDSKPGATGKSEGA